MAYGSSGRWRAEMVLATAWIEMLRLFETKHWHWLSEEMSLHCSWLAGSEEQAMVIHDVFMLKMEGGQVGKSDNAGKAELAIGR